MGCGSRGQCFHDPSTPDRQGNDIGSQYRSIIFYADEDQHHIVNSSRDQAQSLWPHPIVTQIEHLEAFYPAEDYHQDYFAKNPDAGYCQVIINPKLTVVDNSLAVFFEGCLSVAGYQAIVDRALDVRVECLNARGEEVTINAHGWYARILQHEIDHLNGILYIDRMKTRTLSTTQNMHLFWKDRSIKQVLAELE